MQPLELHRSSVRRDLGAAALPPRIRRRSAARAGAVRSVHGRLRLLGRPRPRLPRRAGPLRHPGHARPRRGAPPGRRLVPPRRRTGGSRSTARTAGAGRPTCAAIRAARWPSSTAPTATRSSPSSAASSRSIDDQDDRPGRHRGARPPLPRGRPGQGRAAHRAASGPSTGSRSGSRSSPSTTTWRADRHGLAPRSSAASVGAALEPGRGLARLPRGRRRRRGGGLGRCLDLGPPPRDLRALGAADLRGLAGDGRRRGRGPRASASVSWSGRTRSATRATRRSSRPRSTTSRADGRSSASAAPGSPASTRRSGSTSGRASASAWTGSTRPSR